MKTRYQIIESAAGEGGFGRIDKAFDMILERNIAMKILDPLFKGKSITSRYHEIFKRSEDFGEFIPSSYSSYL
jgi:hypothetical protein